ncbi:hypothetical protein EV147_3886 [Cupriavidus agavae]|uniref:Uncharacterized protein n=1 Tax=Cupriavidus agavae TaxID=1001822 RepID=A0A4Q7RP33_9BURK|nr:hypothetical protein EV147_3886 [Cupriavidus agavae]
MNEQWIRIKRALSTLECLDQLRLRPGASAERIAELEQHLVSVSPEAFERFWAYMMVKTEMLDSSVEHYSCRSTIYAANGKSGVQLLKLK